MGTKNIQKNPTNLFKQLARNIGMFFFLLPSVLSTEPVQIGTIVTIEAEGEVSSPVSVAGSPEGYMAVWKGSGDTVRFSFSADFGATWSPAQTIGEDCSYIVSIVAKDSTFLVAWVQTDPGFATGSVFVRTTNNQGMNWSDFTMISPPYDTPGGRVNPPPVLAQNNSGFMAAWSANSDFSDQVWASFSPDGTTWSTPYNVTGDDFSIFYNELSLAGNPSGFLVSWLQNDEMGLTAYTSFTSNQGTTWSSPIINPATTPVASGTFPTVAGSSAGFIMSWIDGPSQNVHTNFTTDDGANWMYTTLVSNQLAQHCCGLAPIGFGFIVTWIDDSFTGWGSFSSDFGQTWNTPTQISDTNSVANYFFNALNIGVINSSYNFTWLSSGEAALSSFVFVPSSPKNEQRSTLFPVVEPIRQKRGLFDK